MENLLIGKLSRINRLMLNYAYLITYACNYIVNHNWFHNVDSLIEENINIDKFAYYLTKYRHSDCVKIGMRYS